MFPWKRLYDQYQLGMRALDAEVTDLRAAITVLESRCALRPGEVGAPVDDAEDELAGGPPARAPPLHRGRLRARGCVLRLKRRRLERRGSSHPCRMARVGSIVMLRHKYGLPKVNLWPR